jgi:hypothetical protein
MYFQPSEHVQIAMHGAALMYPLYMPTYGGVVEFWPKNNDIWRCFEHVATMSGKIYQRWENPDPARFRTDAGGDYTNINIDEFRSMFASVLDGVEARRKDLPIRGQE